MDGSPSAVVANYLAADTTTTLEACDGNRSTEVNLSDVRPANMMPVVTHVRLVNSDGHSIKSIQSFDPLSIEIGYQTDNPIRDAHFGVAFEDSLGNRVFFCQTRFQFGSVELQRDARGVLRCHVPRVPLPPGRYYLTIGCGTSVSQLDLLPRAIFIDVIEADVYGTGQCPPASLSMVLVDATWTNDDHH